MLDKHQVAATFSKACVMHLGLVANVPVLPLVYNSLKITDVSQIKLNLWGSIKIKGSSSP